MTDYRLFFEEAATKMYPSVLLHGYGVNGKISGSVGAVGEMSGGVAAILHAPLGCGFHYRFSARRRHQPFFALFSSDLTETEIVFGGEEKLLAAARAVWTRYRPALLMLIPSPVTDVLNEDLRGAAETLRAEGIPAAAIRSELFSHRDKSYARRRLKELAALKITGDNRLEMELKGCGFTLSPRWMRPGRGGRTSTRCLVQTGWPGTISENRSGHSLRAKPSTRCVR